MCFYASAFLPYFYPTHLQDPIKYSIESEIKYKSEIIFHGKSLDGLRPKLWVFCFLLRSRSVSFNFFFFRAGGISYPDERDLLCVGQETATRFALFWSFIAFMGNKIFMYQMKSVVVKCETRTWRSEIRNLYNFYIRILHLVNSTPSSRIATPDQIQFIEASIIGPIDERAMGIP